MRSFSERTAGLSADFLSFAAVQCEVMRQVEPAFIRAGLLDNSEHQAAAVQVRFQSSPHESAGLLPQSTCPLYMASVHLRFRRQGLGFRVDVHLFVDSAAQSEPAASRLTALLGCGQVVQALLATADDSDSCSQPGISHARWRQLMPTTEGQVGPEAVSIDLPLGFCAHFASSPTFLLCQPARRLGDAPGKIASAM